MFLSLEEGITSILAMSKMASFKDNLKWFHDHCSSQHHLLETALPMLDVAVFIMQHIDRLSISFFVSNKVRADFMRIVSAYTKSKGTTLAIYIEPIASRLLVLIDDENFRVEKFTELHHSIMASASGISSITIGLCGAKYSTD